VDPIYRMDSVYHSVPIRWIQDRSIVVERDVRIARRVDSLQQIAINVMLPPHTHCSYLTQLICLEDAQTQHAQNTLLMVDSLSHAARILIVLNV
jgi:hypothetical protein